MRKFMHERNCIDAIFSRLSSSCCHSHTTTTTRRISAVHVEANKKWALHNFQIASCTFRAIKTVLFSFDSNKLGRRDLLAISRHFGRTTEMQRKALQLMGACREKGKENYEFFEPLIGEKNNELKYERLFLIRCWIPSFVYEWNFFLFITSQICVLS